MKPMVLAALLSAALLAPPSAQFKTPTDWKWRTDGPAALVVEGSKTTEVAAGREWFFVAMPPGWHVTTGPGAVLYPPDYLGRGNFGVEAEVFLFPGESQEGYGVFAGGRDLEEGRAPSYLAFVARRDGRAGIFVRTAAGLTPLVDWVENDAVLPNLGGTDAVKNVLRVEVGPAEIQFSANGKPIASTPRTPHDLAGHVGFRVGARVNLHASRLDVTYRLAPVPPK
ncbi:MAG TPA: hypothetical protein VMM93_13315 [Vicinamibacterales bacterium]|nr:hypothetical protein [Vicinamibacterales bacterium]